MAEYSMNSKLPCIDCITLAVCKSSIDKKSASIKKLYRKCSSISSYVIDSKVRKKEILFATFSDPPNGEDVTSEYQELKSRLNAIYEFFQIKYRITKVFKNKMNTDVVLEAINE